MHGLARCGELPIIRKIAVGSLRNKLLIILPAILLLSQFLPFLLTPILMLGGAYLCYEGAEKVWHKLGPHHDDHGGAEQALPDEEDDRGRGRAHRLHPVGGDHGHLR